MWPQDSGPLPATPAEPSWRSSALHDVGAGPPPQMPWVVTTLWDLFLMWLNTRQEMELGWAGLQVPP